MRIRLLVLSGVLSMWILCGCAPTQMTLAGGPGGPPPKGNNVNCSRPVPCMIGVGATTGGVSPLSCTVAIGIDQIAIAPGVDVVFSLPPQSESYLEFIGPVGVQIAYASPDFIDRGYGNGGVDTGTYTWTGNTNRNKIPRKYAFSVQWINPHVDQPIFCGLVDPLIVNSLDPATFKKR